MRLKRDMIQHRQFWAWAALLAWSALIWYLNTRPDLPLPNDSLWNNMLSQGGHLFTHAVLAALAWWVVALTWGERHGLVLASVAASVHAVLDEGVQFLVPTRHVSLGDLAFDLAGVALAVLAIRLWHKTHAPR